MEDTPGGLPESADPANPLDLPASTSQPSEDGEPFELPEFKEAPILNGLFLTLTITVILADLGMLIATIFRIYVADAYVLGVIHGQTNLRVADQSVGVVWMGFRVVFLASSVCMLFWMFRSYGNSIALAQRRLRYSRGGATAGLIIPIVSFFRPYLAVAEMVKIAKDRINWASNGTPFYVRLWWSLNISIFAGSLIARLVPSFPVGPARFYISNYAALLVYWFAIFKYLFLIKVILVIWEGGRQRGQLGLVSVPQPRIID